MRKFKRKPFPFEIIEKGKSGRICLCPSSIKWIKDHLIKSARTQFLVLIAHQSRKIKRIIRKKRRTAKQRAATRKLIAFNKRRRR